jgi:hypothetical protein
MTKIRVNIHPRPKDTDWDISIPYHGNSYNQSKHVLDEYLDQFLVSIPTDRSIVLVSNGAPVSRQIAVKNIIESRYPSIEIEPTYNHSNPDPIFSNRYVVVNRPKNFIDTNLLEFYLENWTEMEEFSQRYEFESHSRDHGYFHAVRRKWYQWGELMPVAPSIVHQKMYHLFQELFVQTIDILETVLRPISLSRDLIRQGLMFRLNHNPPGSGWDGKLVNRHGDNSIVTAWMSQTHPGAIIDFGQQTPINPTPINKLYDVSSGIMVFPGFDYCDVSQSSTLATWHSVEQSNSNEHRVSLVAFLKHL